MKKSVKRVFTRDLLIGVSHHGVGLAGARLAVGKAADLGPGEDGGHQGLHQFSVHVSVVHLVLGLENLRLLKLCYNVKIIKLKKL